MASKQKEPTMTRDEALKLHGHCQTLDYRRAHRRAYRAGKRRIDYMPGRKATAILEQAIANGWALTAPDTIEQALIAWGEWMNDPE